MVKSLKLARQELVNHPRLGGLERAIYSIIRNTEYPDEQDLEGVAISLARVQFTYRLDPLDMAKGVSLLFRDGHFYVIMKSIRHIIRVSEPSIFRRLPAPRLPKLKI